MGSIVLARAAHFISSYAGDEIRPFLVYGLWRDGSDIKNIEIMPFQGNLSEAYTADFVINTPELIQRFGVIKECKLSTNKTFIVENTRQYFPSPKYASPLIDPMLWPEILARRVNALLYDPYRHFRVDSNLGSQTREGFTFEKIDPVYNLRNNEVPAPDTLDHAFNRKPSRILDQQSVNMVASFAMSYHKYAKSTGAKERDANLIYPALQEWKKLEHEDFPRWPEKEGRTPSRETPPAARP